MEAIKALLNELSRCDVVNDFNDNLSYNGIDLVETSEGFQKRLHRLYECALSELPFLEEGVKAGIVNMTNKYAESQRLFDVPNESILESMNREIEAGNTNPSLKKERDFVKMICECVSLQKYYLNEFAAAIGYTPTEQESEQPSIIVDDEPIADEDANQEWVYGYKGIMSAFKWGKTKVANFLKDSFYEEAIVREGDKIALNVPKARELMQKKEKERKKPKRRKC